MNFRAICMIIGGGLVLSACANPELEQKLADLEKKVEALEKRPAAPPARGQQPAAPADPAAEKAATDLLNEVNSLVEAKNYDGAKAKLAELTTKYGATRAARSAGRMAGELAVFGTDAGELEIEKWFQGETDYSKAKVTFMVFWETWCPHCRREAPKMEALHNKWKDKGLQVIGVTKITKSATEEGVIEFIKENNMTYPNAKEKGTAMSGRFGVRGIPAAAAVSGGKIIWRGHPAKVTDAVVEGWLK